MQLIILLLWTVIVTEVDLVSGQEAVVMRGREEYLSTGYFGRDVIS
jgi:hypothetical protein